MRIQSVKLNRQTMHLPRKFLPLVWSILQRPPFFTLKNGRIGTASDSLKLAKIYANCYGHMTKMADMPIYGKNPLKVFLSRTKGLMSLGLGM